MEVVFIFSSKTSVLVGCGLKQAEYELNTTRVSDQCLSLAENLRIGKQAFSAGFHTENDLFKNPSTEMEFLFQYHTPGLGGHRPVVAIPWAKPGFAPS